MSGTVELRHGDLLRSVSDMAVLPCSTSGTVSTYVRRLIDTVGLHAPKSGMPLGAVEVRPLVEVGNLASYVAWAASVQNNWSSLGAIKEIARYLGKVTRDRPEIKSIAAPLLGTNAGGLAPRDVMSTMQEGFTETSASDAKLSLFVLDEAQFLALRGQYLPMPRDDERYMLTPDREPPRVFISYAGAEPKTQSRVEWLAERLRDRGLAIRFAPWHLRLGADLPQWMTNEIQIADRVLIVSDEAYAERANERIGGVGWETMIIQGDLMKRSPNDIKYLGVVITEAFDEGVPTFLKAKYLLHWPILHENQMLENRLSSELLNAES